MTLGTGTLYLGPSTTGGTTANIRYEILGSYGAYNLSTAITAEGGSFNSMRDFAGYTHAVPVQPTKCVIENNGIIELKFFCNAANDGCKVRWRKNSGTWTSYTIGTSPFAMEFCTSSTYYEAEAIGYIGGLSSSACYDDLNVGGC